MTATELVPSPAPATASGSSPRRVSDFVVVSGAWALVVLAAAVFPLAHPQVARAALFVHLMSMAVGFGTVVMVDVYGLLWLFGYRTLSEVLALTDAAHAVIALGVGGLLASGIALKPDITSPMARLKLVLVLILMLNGVAAQRMLHRMRNSLPGDARGANIPWVAFQRVLAAAAISQATWWGAITIGFLTNAYRNSLN
jgi:hypothetical protein